MSRLRVGSVMYVYVHSFAAFRALRELLATFAQNRDRAVCPAFSARLLQKFCSTGCLQLLHKTDDRAVRPAFFAQTPQIIA